LPALASQILVVLGSFAAAFFLIPREPCVATERMTANSAGYNPSTGDFEVYLHLFIKFQSFSYLDMGFNELAVNLTDAASGGYLGNVNLPGETNLMPRSSTVVRFNVTMSQRTAPAFAPCAVKLATGQTCVITAAGEVTPQYAGSTLPRVHFNVTAALSGESQGGLF